MLIKKINRWNPNVKMKFKRHNKFKVQLIEDNLRGAKQAPDWIQELLFSGTDENFADSKTA